MKFDFTIEEKELFRDLLHECVIHSAQNMDRELARGIMRVAERLVPNSVEVHLKRNERVFLNELIDNFTNSLITQVLPRLESADRDANEKEIAIKRTNEMLDKAQSIKNKIEL